MSLFPKSMQRFTLIFLLFCTSALSYGATWQVFYAQPEDPGDRRTTYPLKVLELALKHTGVNYDLIPSDKILGQGSSIQKLKANREVSLIWSMTDAEREQELLPVRIPIYKGLIGWRLLLVKKSNRHSFRHFSSIEELRQYNLAQGYDWPDTKILQSNGFEVATSSDYFEMFDMVRLERATFFPRSLVEIWAEAEHPVKGENLAVESGLAVRYPTATYFFFNKKNLVLQKLVETGFRRAIAAGDFDKLFYAEHADFIDKARINERVVFELDNPILPPATPVDDPKLWYSVESMQVRQ